MADHYAKYGAEFINMLSELELVGDEHLDKIRTAQHRIELSLEDTRQCTLRHVGLTPKRASLDKSQIAKMVELDVMELAQTEWDRLLSLHRKRAARSDSVLTTEYLTQKPCAVSIPFCLWTNAWTTWEMRRFS